jgi:hypothetical protein
MLASELIKELQELITKHGDLEIRVDHEYNDFDLKSICHWSYNDKTKGCFMIE